MSYPKKIEVRFLNLDDRSEAIMAKHQGDVQVTMHLTERQASVFCMTRDKAYELALAIKNLLEGA